MDVKSQLQYEIRQLFFRKSANSEIIDVKSSRTDNKIQIGD